MPLLFLKKSGVDDRSWRRITPLLDILELSTDSTQRLTRGGGNLKVRYREV